MLMAFSIRSRAIFSASAVLIATFSCSARAETTLQPYRIESDAIPKSLTGAAGDAARGREIVTNRQVGLCVLCHAGPFPELRFQSNLAPDLRGVGSRLSEGQLRLRIVDPAHGNPATIMPSYYRTEGLTRVTPALRGKPLLSAGQIEDVVAFLATLRD
jgi:sulfur-oxidizing protein SoxX